MAQFDGGRLIRAFSELERTENALAAGVRSYAVHLAEFESAYTDLPLSTAFKSSVRRQIQRASSGPERADVVKEFALEIKLQFLDEYSAFGFYAVPAERKDGYDDPLRWFGQEIFANRFLSKAQRDAAEACRCYALGRWTASVFHCMRMLELGLQGLASYLGVTLSYPLDMADWGKLLGEIDGKIESLKKNTPRSPARAEDLEGLSRCAADLRYCKEIWRDNVCHARENYDQDEAKDVLARVKSMMTDLAKKLKNA